MADQAMCPARLITAPFDDPFFKPGEIKGYRPFQGIPGIEAAGGWFWYCFYTGTEGENPGNYVLLYRVREKDLLTPPPGLLPFMAVVPPAENVRCFDPCLWVSPDGKLRLFWAQSENWVDGREGVWMSVCGDPAGEAAFSAPRRIANGIMMNKPVVTKAGVWLLPCSIWSYCTERYTVPVREELYSNCYASVDGGETFSLRGHADYEKRLIDENMIYERKDGSLTMLIRASDGIGRAESRDGGYTWENERDSGLGGPCSRFHVRRLRSGALLLVNHVRNNGRNNLAAMLSYDDGESWTEPLYLDRRSNVSYPDSTEAGGRIYIIHDRDRTGEREFLVSRITEADILAGRPVTPGSVLAAVCSKAM